MLQRCLAAVLILAGVAVQARAGHVTLKDGESLEGELIKVEAGSLTFKSADLGPLTVPLSQISTLSTTKPAVVVLEGGKTLHGTISVSSAGKWSVTSASGSQEFQSGDIQGILPEAAYHAQLTAEHARIWQAWKGAASAGYSLQKGAENAHSISLNVNATRHRPSGFGIVSHWRTDAMLTMLFASTNQSGLEISSNTLSASIRQNYMFKPHDFVFVLAEADHIEPQNLYLRQTYGGGLGRDLIEKKALSLSVLGGLTFVNEKFSGPPANQYAEALAGERVRLQLFKGATLDHYLDFYPNLTSGGQYRFDTSTLIGFHLFKRLTANLGVTDFYTSHVVQGNPITVVGSGGTVITLPPSATKNNFAFTTGLGVTF